MRLSLSRRHAIEITKAALAGVDPYNLIRKRIGCSGNILTLPDSSSLDLKSFDHIYIIGVGKGAAPLARGMEEILGDKLSGGQIIVKYGHTDKLKKVNQHQAGHPLPDENTLIATKQVLEYTTCFTPRDLVFVLITGGGSALMESLPEGTSLTDLINLNQILLQCGATIHEINCVRKHVSRVKGGQLARFIAPARGVVLILSDVIGDDMSVIASGPTTPDHTTFTEAMHILQKYQVVLKIPESIRTHLEKGYSVQIPETPKPGDQVFMKMQNILIGNNGLALIAAERKASSLGYHTHIYSSAVQGPVEQVAKMIVAMISGIQESNHPVKKPACILMGGEPTVIVKGKGKGGRNQHLALMMVHMLRKNKKPFIFLSCGSDGTDGPTDAAGALVTWETLKQSEKRHLNIQNYLDSNDAYHFFEPLNALIKTGPTRTNVMDIMVVVVP